MKPDLKSILWETFGGLTEPEIMGLTIYGEARGESHQGKIAVGSVILERVEHRDWDGKTIHEVCLSPYQFSCFLPRDPNFNALKLIAQDWGSKATCSMVLSECYVVALGLISGEIPPDPDIARTHCCQYVTTAYRKAVKKNRWWDKMALVTTIGNHEFYSDMAEAGLLAGAGER